MLTRLLLLARPVTRDLVASTILRTISLAGTAALLLYPTWVFTHTTSTSPWMLALIMVLIAVTAAGARWGEQVCGHRSAFGLLAQMRVDLYQALVRQGTPRVHHGSGNAMAVATRDINAIEVFYAHTIAPTITAGLFSVGAVAWLFTIDPLAGMIGLGGIAIAWLLPLLGGSAGAQREVGLRAELSHHLAEDAAGRLEIRSYGAEDQRMRHLEQREADLLSASTATGTRTGLRQGIALLWPWVAGGSILITTGNVFAAVLILAISPALDAVEAFARTLPAAWASARRYIALIDAPVTIVEPSSPVPVPEGPLRVEWRNVVLPGGKEITVDVAPGEHIGIIGPSGIGKSTLAAHLLRLSDPKEGAVLIGGVHTRHVALENLRGAVTLVEQTPVLFRGTVLDNLRVGNPTLSDSDARTAMERASASDIDLDSDAAALSGGQRQRVCLARALARRPRVLVLDEATSHQDAANQAALSDAVKRLERVTVIVIAHRKAALAQVDRVVDLGQMVTD